MSSGPNMLKFILGKGQGPANEREKVQKQLFGFSREVNHGFPNKPSCLAWDPILRIIGIAAKGGRILIYGKPGVELELELEDEVPISILTFIPGSGRLICVTSDNYIHLLEIADMELEIAKSIHMEGRLKSVTAVCVESSRKKALIGTEGGNIYSLSLQNLTIGQGDQEIIYQDKVITEVPDNFKVCPGSVEAILEYETDANKILIGYTRGLVVAWDKNRREPLTTFVAQQQLESLSWFGPDKFVSSHNDGSYNVWDTSSGTETEPPTTPYGPYPCKPITKIYGSAQGSETWKIFSGGMPRASYGDKYTVSVNHGESDHVVFDLTSKIIDFLVVETSEGLPDSLIILSEEELVAVDLKIPGWPQYELPYLHSIHASAITCLTLATSVLQSLMDDLVKYKANTKTTSDSQWPVDGGSLRVLGDTSQNLLITGHEDGSIRFWGIAGSVMTHLNTFKSSKFFKVDDFNDSDDDIEDQLDEEGEDEWPPFRRVGIFDPYSDDPRLAVKKLAFSPEKKMLAIGGTGGQVLLCSLGDAASDPFKVCQAEIVTEKEGFAWKGHQPLMVKTSAKQEVGWQPRTILQITPPASITALVLSDEWSLLGAGTAHGFVLLDLACGGHLIHSRSTLNAQDIANADDNPMSRRKSLKKSLRESFRRMRKGRSQRIPDKKKPKSQTNTIGRETMPEIIGPRPAERQVEARGFTTENGLGSIVRCLYFAKTYTAGPAKTSPSLWVGTNSGQVLVFLLTITPEEKRKTDKVTLLLAKEIQLKHRAPVIDIVVYDSGGLPVEDSRDNCPSPHKVLIVSEEQFKIFQLPNLKPCGKYKLTAQEGARVRRMCSVTFTSKTNADLSENCAVFLTNLGDISVLMVPELRRQTTTAAIKKEDVVGITSMSFSSDGDGVYMSSSSELQYITVAAKRVGLFSLSRGALEISPEHRASPKSPSDTDRQADLQNRQNEWEAEQNWHQSRSTKRSFGEEGTATDTHNDTTVSEASGDITLDSVKDHMTAQTAENNSIDTSSKSRTERVETVSMTMESVSICQTQQFAVPAVPGTSTSITQDEATDAVNGSTSNDDVQIE